MKNRQLERGNPMRSVHLGALRLTAERAGYTDKCNSRRQGLVSLRSVEPSMIFDGYLNNLTWLASQTLKKAPCQVFNSDLRIHIPTAKVITYPDASVTCGDIATSLEDRYAVTNPSLLVEVTSPATERYDRGSKLNYYQQLPSLDYVVVISHVRPEVTVFQRNDTEWTTTAVTSRHTLEIPCGPVHIDVEELYRGIALV